MAYTRKLTDEKLAYLKEHFPEKLMKQWAAEYRVSFTTIKKYAMLMGALKKKEKKAPHNLTREQLAELKAHFYDKSCNEWAEELGVTPTVIRRYGRRWGTPPMGARKISNEQLDNLKKDFFKKKPKQWAKELGVLPATILRYGRRWGMYINGASDRGTWTDGRPTRLASNARVTGIAVDGVQYDAKTYGGGCEKRDLADKCLVSDGMSEVGRFCLLLRSTFEVWKNVRFESIKTEP